MAEEIESLFKTSENGKVEIAQDEAIKILNAHPRDLGKILFAGEAINSGQAKKRLEELFLNDAVVAKVSYWGKWLPKEQRKEIEEIIAERKNEQESGKESLPLDLDRKYSKSDLEAIARNLGALQLTYGCSKACTFCGFDAVPGVKAELDFLRLKHFFQKFGNEFSQSQPLLYWASEPSDYKSSDETGEKTYKDVHVLTEQYAHYDPEITTRNSKDKEWLRFASEKKARVSMYGSSSEIADNVKKENRGLRVVGGGAEHSEGMGVSQATALNSNLIHGIGCFNGVLLTPRGLYNVVQTKITSHNPQGQIVEPIEDLRGAIEIGQNLSDVLRHDLVAISHNSWLIPYLTVYSNGKYIDIATDESGKVTNALPSRFEEISRLTRDIKIISDVGKRAWGDRGPTGVSIEDLSPDEKDIADRYLGRYIENGRVKAFWDFFVTDPIKKKLREQIKEQSQLLGESATSSIEVTLDSVMKKGSNLGIGLPEEFDIKKGPNGQNYLSGVDSFNYWRVYGVTTRYEITTEPSDEISKFWKVGDRPEKKEVREKLENSNLKLRIKILI